MEVFLRPTEVVPRPMLSGVRVKPKFSDENFRGGGRYEPPKDSAIRCVCFFTKEIVLTRGRVHVMLGEMACKGKVKVKAKGRQRMVIRWGLH